MSTPFTRRTFLQAGAGAAAAAGLASPASRNRIAEENKKPGTVEWQLKYYRFDRDIASGLRSPSIEGYASDVSVYPGDEIDLMVSTAPPRPFTIDIYRTGYYGGTGARHMLRVGPLDGQAQPIPMMGMERVRECTWKPATRLRVPSDWLTGVYLAKLTVVDQPMQSYLIFIVKEKRTADLLFQCSDLTWQAYNKWPGWDSLYDDGINKFRNSFAFTGPNVRVSFDRPYCRYGQTLKYQLSLGSGEYVLWEFPMAYWLEQQGYDVVYCSNLDIERDPDVLSRCKVFLSVGHDEYWSRKMYDAVKAARDRGLSLAFFSGNSLSGEVMFYDSIASKKRLRTFARKQKFEDEDLLMGVRSYGPGNGPWVVRRADHWIFEGSGMKNGDYIPGLVGWEYHGTPGKIPGLIEVAGSQLPRYNRRPGEDGEGRHSAVIYPGPKGNWVFNAGTIWWPEGLSKPPGHAPAVASAGRACGVDARVQKITVNILNRFVKDSPIQL